MYCPNCGKQIKKNDNFCRYCGTDLRYEPVEETAPVEVTQKPENCEGEEFVLYDVKKHWMSLVLPVFLVPLFFFYFWNIFLNTHSFFSWVVIFAILGLIFYPIARYKSDKIVITTKFAHIKTGVLNPEEIAVPLEKLDILEVSQSSMGRFWDYGNVSFVSNGERIDYGCIEAPEDLQYIIENPERFVQDAMEEEAAV